MSLAVVAAAGLAAGDMVAVLVDGDLLETRD
jgi:hypothetical protein